MQGTGTTIVQVTPSGRTAAVRRGSAGHLPGCPGGVGLTTALRVLRSGWVIVGSLPTKNGAVSGPGCLIVLDQWGHVRETFAGHGINGPWDMTALDLGGQAVLFVTNVLNGTVAANGQHSPSGHGAAAGHQDPAPSGPAVHLADTTIGSGFPERTDPPRSSSARPGRASAANGVLYVADTLDNRIAAIPDALFRGTVPDRASPSPRGIT